MNFSKLNYSLILRAIKTLYKENFGSLFSTWCIFIESIIYSAFLPSYSDSLVNNSYSKQSYLSYYLQIENWSISFDLE